MSISLIGAFAKFPSIELPSAEIKDMAVLPSQSTHPQLTALPPPAQSEPSQSSQVVSVGSVSLIKEKPDGQLGMLGELQVLFPGVKAQQKASRERQSDWIQYPPWCPPPNASAKDVREMKSKGQTFLAAHAFCSVCIPCISCISCVQKYICMYLLCMVKVCEGDDGSCECGSEQVTARPHCSESEQKSTLVTLGHVCRLASAISFVRMCRFQSACLSSTGSLSSHSSQL